MEDLAQDFGFVLYTTYLKGPREKSTITVPNVRDRAIVFVDGVRQGVVERTRRADEMYIEIPSGEERRVDVLVENMGRVNYGAQLRAERKGAVDGICVFDRLRFGWENRSLSMENLEKLQFEKGKTVWQGRPMFLRGTLTVEGEPCDTFLQTDGFEKGFVLVNGFNIGRYFNSAGPQRTLYVPAALLREGENEIVVFESDNLTSPTVTFLEAPILTK
jgi:beta-galactosidase